VNWLRKKWTKKVVRLLQPAQRYLSHPGQPTLLRAKVQNEIAWIFLDYKAGTGLSWGNVDELLTLFVLEEIKSPSRSINRKMKLHAL
jgi:hypothetical protein